MYVFPTYRQLLHNIAFQRQFTMNIFSTFLHVLSNFELPVRQKLRTAPLIFSPTSNIAQVPRKTPTKSLKPKPRSKPSSPFAVTAAPRHVCCHTSKVRPEIVVPRERGPSRGLPHCTPLRSRVGVSRDRKFSPGSFPADANSRPKFSVL